jgi:hypothetical protein
MFLPVTAAGTLHMRSFAHHGNTTMQDPYEQIPISFLGIFRRGKNRWTVQKFQNHMILGKEAIHEFDYLDILKRTRQVHLKYKSKLLKMSVPL